jgi:hypothetical protein
MVLLDSSFLKHPVSRGDGGNRLLVSTEHASEQGPTKNNLHINAVIVGHLHRFFDGYCRFCIRHIDEGGCRWSAVSALSLIQPRRHRTSSTAAHARRLLGYRIGGACRQTASRATPSYWVDGLFSKPSNRSL